MNCVSIRILLPPSVRTFVERGAFELTARDRRKCGNRFLFQPVEQDSVLVSVLREAGAIPFVKTNVPQTLISFECVNPGTVLPGSTAVACVCACLCTRQREIAAFTRAANCEYWGLQCPNLRIAICVVCPSPPLAFCCRAVHVHVRDVRYVLDRNE